VPVKNLTGTAEGHERDIAGALDGFCQPALVSRTGAGDTPGHDLAALLNEGHELLGLLVVDVVDAIDAEAADFLFAVEAATAALAAFAASASSAAAFTRAAAFAATTLAAATFAFILAAHVGLQIFSPVLSSRQLATAIEPELRPSDLIVIHGEYEAASTLGFYLQRPGPGTGPIHILNGRSSNLWYGSFFPDAPRIFEDDLSLNLKWTQPRRIFLWQDLNDPVPALPGKTYFITQSGGKEILSNQPNPY